MTNISALETNPSSPQYDKLGMVKWLVDAIRAKFKFNFNLGKMVTVDEMIVDYKGKYWPIN